MSMTQKIEIDGKEVPFRASAAIPRIYRMKFHRDIYKDLHELEKSIGDGNPENSSLDMFSLEMFENISKENISREEFSNISKENISREEFSGYVLLRDV